MRKWLNKMKTYFKFRKLILEQKDVLFNLYNTKVDNICRLYTVITMDDMDLEYGEPVIKKKISIYLKNMEDFLITLRLQDLIVPKIKKLDDYNYLIILEYKLIKIDKIIRRTFYLFLITTLGIFIMNMI